MVNSSGSDDHSRCWQFWIHAGLWILCSWHCTASREGASTPTGKVWENPTAEVTLQLSGKIKFCQQGPVSRFTLDSTGNLLGVATCLLASEIPKDWPKLSLSEVRKQQLDGFSAVGRPQCFRASWGKNAKLPAWSSIQVHTQDVFLQYPRNFQTILGSLDLSYRENVMEQMLECLFAFPCECGGFLNGNTVRKLLLKNDLQANIFKKCVTLRAQNAEKAMLLWWRKSINRECAFRHLSIRNCLDSKMWELRACT